MSGGLEGDVLRNDKKGRLDLFLRGEGISDDRSSNEKGEYIGDAVTRAIRVPMLCIGPVSYIIHIGMIELEQGT